MSETAPSPSGSPEYLAAGVSQTGRRGSNEDCAVWDTLPGSGSVHAFAVVCDGMGGHNAGEVASAMAVEVMERRLRELANGTVPEETPALEATVRAWVAEANEDIYRASLANVEHRGMGTTLALAAVVGERRLVAANVGDSKIFLVRDQQVRQLSTDHTALAEQRRALGVDLAAPEDQVGNPFAHALTRSLGQEPKADPDVVLDVELEPGDLVVLTSDGVTDVLESERFLSAVEVSKTLMEVADEIYRLAFEAGSRDNITVALISRGVPDRLGAGPRPAEMQTLSATVPLLRSPSGTVLHAIPKPAAPPAKGSRLFAVIAGIGIPLVAAAGFFLVGRREAADSAAPRAARSSAGSPAPATVAEPPPWTPIPIAAAVLPTAGQPVSAASAPARAHPAAPRPTTTSAEMPTPALWGPAPLRLAPAEPTAVPVQQAAVEGATVVAVGGSYRLRFTFATAVSSGAATLSVEAAGLRVATRDGQPLLASSEAHLSVPCAGFGTRTVTCAIDKGATAFHRDAPAGELAGDDEVSIEGVLGDGLAISVTAPVVVR